MNRHPSASELPGFLHRTILLAGLLAVLAATGRPQASLAQAAPMPDFRLVDANVNSPRFSRPVSPRDYRLQISAYYFGDSG